MVSRSLRPGGRTSRERLLAAAAIEFAERGFDGAKVDRIARRARLNKAMLYYHFTNKAALYRAILADLFSALAVALAEGRSAAGSPESQIRQFVRTVAAQIDAHPHFPAIWLRELAEGGRHLDVATVARMREVLGVLTAILKQGRQAGVFRDAHPALTNMGIVGPLLLFAASTPIRQRFAAVMPAGTAGLARETVLAYVETGALAALGVPDTATGTRGHRSGRRSA